MAIAYPSNLPNPQVKGYKNAPSQDYFITQMDYAFKKRARYYGNMEVNITFKFTKNQMREFNRWFYGDKTDQLGRGVKTFTANWEILTISFLYEFTFAEGGQPEPTYISNDNYEVKMKAYLLTDIFEIIALDDITALCPEAIDCMETFLNFAATY